MDPNDHVNQSQSSNDSFPTALHIATTRTFAKRLRPALDRLRTSLDAKAREWGAIVKIGRTHLQDATPLTLGQEFSGYVAQLDANRASIDFAAADVRQLAQGGTAVGTGLNAPDGSGEAMATELSAFTGYDFTPAPTHSRRSLPMMLWCGSRARLALWPSL